MKMTKTRFTSMFAFLIGMTANSLFAQGVYVSITAGYSFKASSMNINNYIYAGAGGIDATSYKQNNVSLGKGLNFEGAFGYMLNKNIGAEIGLNYLSGGKTSINQATSTFESYLGYSSTMLRIHPSIVIVSGMNGINPYAKFGIIVGSGSVLEKVEYKYISDLYPTDNSSIYKLNGDFAFGLSASIGALYKLSDKISLFGELAMVNMSYAPSKGELTTSTINGVDQLPVLTINYKQFIFVDSYIIQAYSKTEPTKSLKQKYPFGSAGINIGLKYSL